MACKYNSNGPSFNALWAIVLIVCAVGSCTANERLKQLRADLVEAGVIADTENNDGSNP